MIFVRNLLLTGMIILSVVLPAQQTQIYNRAEHMFRQGVELFTTRHYAAARACFEQVAEQEDGNRLADREASIAGVKSNALTGLTICQQLDYYLAVCAAELGSADAFRLIQLYRQQHGDILYGKLLAYYSGRMLYQDKKYTEAIASFEKVNPADLREEQQADYYFQFGYCYFVKKKFAEALPLFQQVRLGNSKYVYPAGYYYAYICFELKEYDKALAAFERIRDSRLYGSVIPYYIAQIYYWKGNEKKVEEIIDQALLIPETKYKEEMQFLRARIFSRQKKYAQAIPLYQSYVKAQGKIRPGELFLLAFAQYQEQQFSEAARNLEQIILADDSIRLQAFYYVADCYLQLGQKDKSRLAFQSASTQDPDAKRREISLYHYAKLCYELKQLAEATTSFQQYISQFPEGTYKDEASGLLSTLLLQTRDYDKAYQILEKLNPKTPVLRDAWQKVTYYRAVQLTGSKQWSMAQAMVEQSLDQPVSTDLHALSLYLQAEIFYETAKYTDAIASYLRFLSLLSSSADGLQGVSAYRAYYNLGFCSYKLRDYAEAARYFERAVAESKTTRDVQGKTLLQPDLCLHLADCYFVTKNYSEAIRNYELIIENSWKSNDYAQFQVGMIQGFRGRNKEKISSLNRLVAEIPNSIYAADAHIEMAETYFDEGELADALLYYKKVIQLFPQSRHLADARLKVGLVNYNVGRKTIAIEDLKLVVEKHPRSPQSREALQMLRQIWVELGQAEAYFAYADEIPGLSVGEQARDSLSYEALLKAWDEGGCSRALPLMEQYIQRFAAGIFIAEVRWTHADCMVKLKEYNSALADWEDIIRERRTRYYEQALLKASSVCYYDVKDYGKALQYYRLLQEVASTGQSAALSLLGICRSAYRVKDWPAATQSAQQILSGAVAKPGEEQEIRFILAEGYRNQGQVEQAFQAYRQVGHQPVTERAAEAAFHVADILYATERYRESMDSCLIIKERYAAYPNWVVKTFILLAKNHDRIGNVFQAQATLESIVNQFTGSDELLDEAKNELAIIRNRELQRSIIQPVSPSEELEMDSTGVR